MGYTRLIINVQYKYMIDIILWPYYVVSYVLC